MNPIEVLFQLLRGEGNGHYVESAVTQVEHALQ
jgi:hypothetical protein